MRRFTRSTPGAVERGGQIAMQESLGAVIHEHQWDLLGALRPRTGDPLASQ